MNSNIKTRADPNSLSALEEMDKLILELTHLVNSSGQLGKPGSVDLTRTLDRAKFVRTLIVCRSNKKIDWTKVIQAIAFLIDMTMKMRQ